MLFMALVELMAILLVFCKTKRLLDFGKTSLWSKMQLKIIFLKYFIMQLKLSVFFNTAL